MLNSAAHRLTLSAAELAVLREHSDLRLPPGFDPPPFESTQDDRAMVVAELTDRRVIDGNPDDALGWAPVPPVAVNLAVLAQPTALIRIDASVPAGALRSAYALAGELGASLFARGDGAVELSLFPARSLGTELIRAVPEIEPAAPASTLDQALRGKPVGGRPLVGRLPLAALTEYGPALRLAGSAGARQVTADLKLTTAEAELAERLPDETIGTAHCTVSGRSGDGLAFGQLVWLATEQGWVGLRPDPDDTGRQLVELRSVDRDEIGTWLAPMLARIVAAAA